MKGLALIDLPEHKLKCGEYGDIPEKVAKQLVKDGYFDPKAPNPEAAKWVAEDGVFQEIVQAEDTPAESGKED